MTAKQDALYWREWDAVQRACKAAEQPVPDRHELHRQALGRDVSHKAFTNAEFDQVLAVFKSVSAPASVDPQLRQLDQPHTRRLGAVRDLLRCLGLYIQDPEGYAREIIRDKVNQGSWRNVTAIEDLSDQPPHPDRPSQLEQLIMTLTRALNGRDGFRAAAGDTVHQMKRKAGICRCRFCRPVRPVAAAQQPKPELVEEPF